MTTPDPSNFRSPMLMNADDTAVIVVDVQEKLLPVMDNKADLLSSIELLVKGAGVLSVPVFFTEQYPQGLGKTVSSLSNDQASVFEKKMFSLRQCTQLLKQLSDSNIHNVLLVGIEAHVCILQSALDCIAAGFNVVICVDAVSARRPQDKDTALRRLDSSGVTLTTVESALFEWCETADHPQFKAISKLIK